MEKYNIKVLLAVVDLWERRQEDSIVLFSFMMNSYRNLQNDSYTDKLNRKIFAMVTDQPHADFLYIFFLKKNASFKTFLRRVQTFGCLQFFCNHPHSSVRHYNSMMRQLLYIHQAGLKTV